MKFFLSTIIFISITIIQLFAQPKFNLYPDSIRVEFPDENALVIFEMRNYPHDAELIRQFPATLKEILGKVREASGIDLYQAKPQRVEVRYEPEGTKEVGLGTKPFGEKTTLTIQAIENPKTTMTMIKDKGVSELLPPGWELFIQSRLFKIKVYALQFKSLEAISNQDFTPIVEKIRSEAKAPNLIRSNLQAQLVMKGNQVTSSSFGYVFPGDNIFLTGQGGVGLVQNTLYPELSLHLGLSFRDRFRRSNFRTSLIYNYMFLTEKTSEGYILNGNSFLSGLFEKNFNRHTSQPQWTGIGIGFLVNRQGDYFRNNTAKVFITHTIPGNRVSLTPEFYFTDNYSKFLFGVTLKFSF